MINNVDQISNAWKKYRLKIVYNSLFLATLLFVFVLFTSNPPQDISVERRVLLFGGVYIALVVLISLIYYAFFYIPNYIFYKRMMKAGREKEVRRMIDEHGLEKLIGRDWFIFKKKMKQEKHSKPKPNDIDDEQ